MEVPDRKGHNQSLRESKRQGLGKEKFAVTTISVTKMKL